MPPIWTLIGVAGVAIRVFLNDLLNPQPTARDQDLSQIEKEAQQKSCPKPPPSQPYKPGKGGTVTITLNPPAPSAPKPKPTPVKVAPVQAFAPPILVLPSLWRFVVTAYSLWAAGSAVRNVIQELKPPSIARDGFKFGKLLGGNHIPTPSVQTEWNGWIDQNALQKVHQESYEGFAWWMASAAGDVPKELFDKESKGDFYDQGALLWPHDPRSYNAGVSLLFGARPVSDVFADLWAKSLNHDAQSYRGTTWSEVAVSKQKFPWERHYFESGSVTGQPSFDNLAESVSEILLKAAVIKGVSNPVKPGVSLENRNMGPNATGTKGGLPACQWPLDRGTVIGNQQAQNAVLDVVTNTQLVSVQNKLGPQVSGGITGWLGRFAKSLYLDKALNLLNFMLNVHNAVMLSRNLVATLGEIQTLVINAIGKQMKNEEMKNFDVNKVLGEQFKKLIEAILGKEKSDNLTKKISKYNRILTAATNLLNNVEAILFSLSEMMSLAGEYQGKVGNALKRSGVILEDSYSAMQEKWRMLTGKRFAKIDRVLRGIDKSTEVADNLGAIAGEAVEIPEHLEELGKARKELTSAVKDAPKENSPANKPAEDKAKLEKEQSASPPITNTDKIKPEAEQ